MMIRKLFFNQIIALVIMLCVLFLLPKNAYCIKDGQIVSMTRRGIYFELKTDKISFNRSDSIVIYFKIKNKSKLTAWFIDDEYQREQIIFVPEKKSININFGVGDEIISISDYAPKCMELRPGQEINRVYSFSRGDIVAKLYGTLSDNTAAFAYVNAYIAYFDRNSINSLDMQYICNERPKGSIRQLREGDSGNFWYNLNRIYLSGILFELE
jgi:hypothetical protein